MTSVYNLGRTSTHEIGHYLNLVHVWGDGDCTVDDHVSDTPEQSGAHYGCPGNTTNSCLDYIDPEKGRDLRDMYENYMDYVNDACMFMFSEEQVWRMRSVFEVCRRRMYENGAILEDGANTIIKDKNDSDNSTQEWITLTCHNGNLITEERLDDGDCDCSCCEDETLWTCDTCSNDTNSCSEEMFEWVVCDGTGDGSIGGTYCKNGTLLVGHSGDEEPVIVYCHNGNPITEDKLDNGNCDCSCCEDETYWTCETCSDNVNTCSERRNVFIVCDGTGNGTIIGTYCMNGTLLTGNINNDKNTSGLTDDALLLIIVVGIGIGAGLIAAICVAVGAKKYGLSGTGAAAVPIASKKAPPKKKKKKTKTKSKTDKNGLAGLSVGHHHVSADGYDTPSAEGGLPPPFTGPPSPPPVPSSVTGAAKPPPRFGGPPRRPPPAKTTTGAKRPPPPPSSGRKW